MQDVRCVLSGRPTFEFQSLDAYFEDLSNIVFRGRNEEALLSVHEDFSGLSKLCNCLAVTRFDTTYFDRFAEFSGDLFDSLACHYAPRALGRAEHVNSNLRLFLLRRKRYRHEAWRLASSEFLPHEFLVSPSLDSSESFVSKECSRHEEWAFICQDGGACTAAGHCLISEGSHKTLSDVHSLVTWQNPDAVNV